MGAMTAIAALLANANVYAGYAAVVVHGVEAAAAAVPDLDKRARAFAGKVAEIYDDVKTGNLAEGARDVGDVVKMVEDAADHYKISLSEVASVAGKSHETPAAATLANAFQGIEGLFKGAFASIGAKAG